MTKQWSGNEWQEYVVQLLKIHFSPGEFQEVPDTHGGDHGIEGFSRDGCCYQCYAAEEPIGTAELYTKQRAKISADIKKFCDNGVELAALFGPLKINRWIFVVPRFESADLVKHAERKADEVRRTGLSYVGPDFSISVVTDDEFHAARQTLVSTGKAHVRIEPADVDGEALDSYTIDKPDLVRTLDAKIARFETVRTEVLRVELRREMLRRFVVGQNALEQLNQKYPETFAAVARMKADREEFLRAESMMADKLPAAFVRETAAAFGQALAKNVLGLSDHAADTLKYEAVADWLIRCPLDPVGGVA